MDTDTAVQLYMLMFGNVRVALAIVRLDPDEPDMSPRVVDLNPAARKISGQLSGDSGSRGLDRYFPGLFDAGFSQICRRISGAGGAVDLGESMVGESYYRTQVFSLFNGYFGIVFTDTTERKRAEAEIAQLLAKVQRNAANLEQRVAERTLQLEEINIELDSFAYSVSHDLRAPLRAMKGFAEILLEDQSLGETERTQYLKRILSAAQGMDRLIQDLLAYSRLSRQEILLQTVSLEKVVQDAAQQLELASGAKSYSLEVTGDFPEVIGHHAVLVQVLLNLLTNAIKFIPKGATPKLRIWAEQTQDHCRLFVEDNGIGIAREHQERIFKIFERLHSIESYPGTGVGLAIVRKAVTRLGGRIGVDSRVGEGSRFWIELSRGR
ncbi:MAG: two-component sensor histidine kinase [Geobacteraceae bacterium GWC2_58_44]|nr:MAG: two-component sensor histidine kinase [Geobacteraceae bacterium GWC2_58_44]